MAAAMALGRISFAAIAVCDGEQAGLSASGKKCGLEVAGRVRAS
jgi:hypothetical protein